MGARRRVLALAGVVCTSTLVAGTSLPAEAAQGFSLSTTSRGSGDGSTHATGAVTFTGTRSFRISSTVWDSCPRDGRGAYLSLSVDFVDGSGYGYPAGDAFNRDVDGCDNGKVSSTVTRTFAKKVKRVSVTLFETDETPPAYQSATSTWKDNPRT